MVYSVYLTIVCFYAFGTFNFKNQDHLETFTNLASILISMDPPEEIP